MHRCTLTLDLWLAFAVVIAQSPPTACPRQLNLAGYDVFGPRTLPVLYNENTPKIYAELRSFIWTHWHERRRGYAVVTEFSVEESVPCQTTYLIEPDKYANWHIDKRWKCKKGRPRTGRDVITSVQRLARDRSGYRTDVGVPETADVPPESYLLVLRDVSGQVVREL